MINNEWVPSDTYPGLTAENLADVGDVIFLARAEAAEDHRPDKGETNWSLGVRCYERTCSALTQASGRFDWLSIKSGAGGGPVTFVASIGGHAVRFYRGEPEDVPIRYRQMAFLEFAEQQLAAKQNAHLPTGRGLRIAIENNGQNIPAAIYLVEMDEETGETISIYEITRQGGFGNVRPFIPPVAPVNIPAVTAEPVQRADSTKASSDDE